MKVITAKDIAKFLAEWKAAVSIIYVARPEKQIILDNLADAKRHLDNGDVDELFHSFGEAYRIVQKEEK